MIQCPNCGRDLDIEAAKFCIHCGADLIQKQVYTPPLVQRRSVGRPPPSYRPWIIITGSILTIGIIIISFILVSSYFLSSLFGPPLGSGIAIFSDDDLYKYSSSGTGTLDDPYILSNYYLTNEFIGFSIQNTTKHFLITNCTIEICYEGIHIENVSPGTANIFGNTIFYLDCWVWETGPHAGISVHSSPRVNISNNIIFNAGIDGIVIQNSEECHISNNTISKQFTGVQLEYSNSSVISNNSIKFCDEAIICLESHLVNITRNMCLNNRYSCIEIDLSNYLYISNNYCFNTTETYFPWSSSGIILYTCTNCTITNCTVLNCHQGIETRCLSYSRIHYNHIENNSEIGISLLSVNEESKFNTIYLNTFINNNYDGSSQASDNGTSNYWYHSELRQGNYWSDWNGSGSYSIAGSANAVDLYPLAEPLI